MRSQVSGVRSQGAGTKFHVSLALRNAVLCAIVVSAVAFCGASGFAQQQPVVLKGGKLLTVSHGVIENGVLVMDAGKIRALGTATSVKLPKNAKVIDVAGMTVYPGLIDSEIRGIRCAQRGSASRNGPCNLRPCRTPVAEEIGPGQRLVAGLIVHVLPACAI